MAPDISHLKCSRCGYAQGKYKCRHTDEQRTMVIRRENFKLDISNEFKTWIEELSREYASD